MQEGSSPLHPGTQLRADDLWQCTRWVSARPGFACTARTPLFPLISHVLEAKNVHFSCPVGNGNVGRAELCSSDTDLSRLFVRASRKHSGLH